MPLNSTDDYTTQISEIDNSLSSGLSLVDSTKLENFICYNLAKSVKPYDLTNTIEPTPNSVSIKSDISGPQLIGKTLFLNNDACITSELFGLKVDYVSKPVLPTFDSIYDPIRNISNTVYLDPSTNSIFDSNLKIDVSFNNDAQYTDPTPDNSGMWHVVGNRSQNYAIFNTFSAINSVYNHNNSPFYIEESSYNTSSLGNNSGKYFTLSGGTIGDGVLMPRDISLSNTLAYNNLTSTVIPTESDYTFTDFNSYKFTQDRSTTLAQISSSGVSPVQYVDNNVASEISFNTFDFSGVFQDTNGVGSGFQLRLDVSSGGGYSMNTNPLFSLDDSKLTHSAINPYMALSNLENLTHELVITNGTTTLSHPSFNNQFITIDDSVEKLDNSYNNIDGLINLIVDSSNNRVYYPDGSGSNVSGSYGSKTPLTDRVVVTYPSEGSPTYPGEGSPNIGDFEGANLLTEEDVSSVIEIIAPSTTYSGSDISIFLNSDNRNIGFNNNTIFTVVKPAPFDISSIPPIKNDFSFNSYFSAVDTHNELHIISLKNQYILADDTPILDSSGVDVSGSSATVTVTDINLNDSKYSRLNVHLDTKTILELSSALQLSPGWKLTDLSRNLTGYLIGDAKKRGLPDDDHLFMTTNPPKPLQDLSYEFVITNNTPITNVKAITRAIKISYYDLIYDTHTDDDLSYNTTKTVIYIDQDEIDFEDITTTTQLVHSSVETSSSSDNPDNFIISLGNINTITSPYNKNDYTFEVYKQTRTYKASFFPKIQFYTNIKMETPDITETIYYYKLVNTSSGKDCTYLLKNFVNDITNQNLSNIYITLQSTVLGFSLSSYMLYSKENCSIFKSSIWGKDISSNYVQMSGIVDIDPFFNQTGTIRPISTATNAGTANLVIQFTDILVNNSKYSIDLTNKPSNNSSTFTAKKIIYTTTGTNGVLDQYTPYNDFYDLVSPTDLTVTTLSVIVQKENPTSLLVTIKDGSTTLATITTPDTFINNYNIISIPAAFAKVDYTVGQYPCVSKRVLAYNNHINVLSGIDYYLNPQNAIISSDGNQRANESFKLVTDSFRLLHVDSPSYSSQYNTTYSNITKFSPSNINTNLNCDIPYGQTNYARSVSFSQLRGYHRDNTGTDSITIRRTVTTGVFNLEVSRGHYATQHIDNIYNGASMNLTTVVYGGTTYSLGLKLNFAESMLTNHDNTTYTILVNVPNYTVNVISNPYDTSIEGQVNSNYLTQSSNLLYPYFDNVKPATIKSSGYTLTVTYTVPNANVYSATSGSYIGNPASVESWASKSNYTHNHLLSSINVIPQYKLQRTTNVFYNSYTAYFVISPPVVSVYGVTNMNYSGLLSNIYSLTPSYIASFHINRTTNSYMITPEFLQTTQITFHEDGKPYYDYLTIKQHKYFRIEGNYVTIQMYMNGVAYSGPDDPSNVDANHGAINTLISNSLMTQLLSSYDNNQVSVSFDQTSKVNFIKYRQFIPPINNYSTTENILFSIGNPFTTPNPNSYSYVDKSYYIRLPTYVGSTCTFYQSNLVYDNEAYYMNIDKFCTGNLVNYNALIDTSNIDYDALLSHELVREILFPIYTHSYKQIPVTGVVDDEGNVKTMDVIISEINTESISNTAWQMDKGFIPQYLGVTLSAITGQGLQNMKKIFGYHPFDYTSSKTLYVILPDMIKLTNILGNTVYRVTNTGNTHAPRMTTSNLSLFTSIPDPSVSPNNIPGAGDIQSIYAQNSLLMDRFNNYNA